MSLKKSRMRSELTEWAQVLFTESMIVIFIIQSGLRETGQTWGERDGRVGRASPVCIRI